MYAPWILYWNLLVIFFSISAANNAGGRVATKAGAYGGSEVGSIIGNFLTCHTIPHFKKVLSWMPVNGSLLHFIWKKCIVTNQQLSVSKYY
jgi:hypothetical protein